MDNYSGSTTVGAADLSSLRGHSHLMFCQGRDCEIPVHVCPAPALDATTLRNAALDAYGWTCDFFIDGDPCKAPALTVTWEASRWMPVCERHEYRARLSGAAPREGEG